MSVPVHPSRGSKLLSIWKHPLVRAIAVPVLSFCASLFIWNRPFFFDRAIAREFLSIISAGCFTVLSLSPVIYIQSYGEVHAISTDFLGLRMAHVRIEAMLSAAGGSPHAISEFAGVMEKAREMDRDFGVTKKMLHNWFVGIVLGICTILAYCFLVLASIQILPDLTGFYWLILCCLGVLDGVYESFSGYLRIRRHMDAIGTSLREALIDCESLSADLQVILQAARDTSPAAPTTQNASPKTEPSNSADQ